MSLERAIQKLTNVIQAAARIDRNTTPIEFGPDGQMRPLNSPAMSPVNPNEPQCATAHPKGTLSYCACTPYSPGKKCCYKDSKDPYSNCTCLINISTPERTDYQSERRDCAGVEFGISYA